MKTLAPLSIILISIFIVSCKKESKPKNTSQLNGTSLIIGDPFNYGLDDLALFPVGSNYRPEVVERRGDSRKLEAFASGTVSMGLMANDANTKNDVYAETEYINRHENVFDIRNILFRNLKTGKTYTLTNNTVHIISFALHKEFEKPLIFYRVVKKDYNKDSVYNAQDGIQLYTSDLRGKHFTQITPDSESFDKYELYLKSQTMLVKTRLDNNKDSAYNHHDETNFREVSLKEPAMGEEIFSQGMRDSLRSLILPAPTKD